MKKKYELIFNKNKLFLNDHKGSVNCCAISGELFASGSSDKRVNIYKENKLFKTLIGHSKEITTIKFTNNG